MPAPTYTLIDSVTLTSSASSVTFSSISQSFGDLVLSINATSAAADQLYIQFNDDTGANYSAVNVYNTTSNSLAGRTNANITYGVNFPSLTTSHIMDYSATDKHKTILSRPGSATTSVVGMNANRWASTSGITKIVITGFASMTAGSTFFLYGIAKAL